MPGAAFFSATDQTSPTVECRPVEELPGWIKVGYAAIKVAAWIESQLPFVP